MLLTCEWSLQFVIPGQIFLYSQFWVIKLVLLKSDIVMKIRANVTFNLAGQKYEGQEVKCQNTARQFHA